jgi:hypothetical protein
VGAGILAASAQPRGYCCFDCSSRPSVGIYSSAALLQSQMQCNLPRHESGAHKHVTASHVNLAGRCKFCLCQPLQSTNWEQLLSAAAAKRKATRTPYKPTDLEASSCTPFHMSFRLPQMQWHQRNFNSKGLEAGSNQMNASFC